MTEAERMAALKAYADAHGQIMRLVEQLGDADLDRHPPGEWSVRQIVHHLADTEVFRSTRLRRLLSEPAPLILAFDEGEMARLLHYERPISASLALFDASVRSSLELIALMTAADWSRSGNHSEFGPFTMDDWLQRAVDHLPAHAQQLRETLRA
jgi:hypothetical protein